MRLLEIVTDVGVYTASLDEYDVVITIGDNTAPRQTPLEIFQRARTDALNGCCMQGWTPTEDKRYDVPCVFTIENGARVKSCRMYEYTPVGVDGFNADATPTPSTPYPFTCNGEYLGNKLRIVGVAFKTPTTEYLLPIFVNDKPATDYMKTAALSQQIQLCKEAEGIAPTEYLIIIPDVWLEPVAAADYLTDYVREVEPMTAINGGGKAKAWPGWSE